MEIKFNDRRFDVVLEKIARSFGSSSTSGEWFLTQEAGSGFIKTWQLQDDISVMLMNSTFNMEMLFKRNPNLNQQFFILHFYDLFPKDEAQKMGPVFYIQNQPLLNRAVCFSNLAINCTIHIPANTNVHAVTILFHRNFIQNFIDPSIFDTFISNYYYRELHGEQVEYIDSVYRAIMHEIITEHALHPITKQFIYSRILLLMEKLMINFLEKLKTGVLAPKIKVDEVNNMIQAEAELVKNFSEPAANISSLSKMAGMSPTKFKKQFRNFYGLPVFEYYQKNRMLYAKNLLKQGVYSIQEVGNNVGYTNLGHFAAAFKKEFGLLPKDWVQSENKLKPLIKE